MPELTCPHCGKVFQVDESDYSNLVSQVKNAEFEKELHTREEVIKGQAKIDLEKEINIKDAEIEKLKANEENHKKEVDIAVKNAISEKDAKISELNQEIKNKDAEKELAVKTAVADKNAEIERLKGEESNLKGAHKNDVDRIIAEKDAQIKQLKETHESELALKNQEIEQIKDFKHQQNVKLIGEDLEQHCLNEFNTYRMGAFPKATFEKDNTVVEGTKGDFIFRDYDEDGTEIISIMFDMKNESDLSATKHKNEDFFKKLDKDRTDKGCEYAVLVSVLEPDNDYYNNGIVDVSYQYDKMYVIRPQFFIPLITLLRNAARNSLQAKKELITAREQNRDFTNFEEDLDAFKESFFKTYNNAKARHDEAVKQIDEAIAHLSKIKEALTTSNSHLDTAANKVNDITVKKLTKRSPLVLEQIEEASKNKND